MTIKTLTLRQDKLIPHDVGTLTVNRFRVINGVYVKQLPNPKTEQVKGNEK